MATTSRRQVLDGRPSIPSATDQASMQAAVNQVRTRLDKIDAAVNRAFAAMDGSSTQQFIESLQAQVVSLSKQIDAIALQLKQLVGASNKPAQTFLVDMDLGDDDAQVGPPGPPGPIGPQGERGHTMLLDHDDYDAHFVVGPPGERGPSGPPGSAVMMDFTECCCDDFPVGFPPSEGTAGGGAGTVTSVDVIAPVAGITATGGPITSSGSITLALADDLAELEDISTFGFAARTEIEGWTTREILGTPNQITVSDGLGADFDPEIGIDPAYPGQDSITTLGTVTTGVWSASTIDVTHGGTGLTSAGSEGTLLVANGSGGWGYLGPNADGWVLTIVGGLPDWSAITTVGTIGTGVWQGTAVAANFGGTGFTSYTVGDILYASTTSALSKLADVATGNALISGGVGVAPSWGKIGLTTHVSGTLLAANGGTANSTYADGDILYAVGGTLAKLSTTAENHVLTLALSGGVLFPQWAGAPSSALTATDIGYGNGSNVLTGTSTFTWTNSTLTMQLGAGTGPSTIQTATASSGANAASLTIQTGGANSGVVGAGLLKLLGGPGAGASAAGDVEVTAGNNPSTGAGGSVRVTCGTSSSGTAGNFTVTVNGTTRLTIANTGAATFQSSIAATSAVFSSTLESTSLRVTGSTAPDNGMYLQATGVVGLSANSTAAYKYGSNAFVSQNNNTRDLGETGTGNWRNIYSQNAVTVASDLRNKTAIKTSDLGLDFVLRLRPVSYRQIVGSNKVKVLKDGTHVETPVKGKRRHYGFIAQEVRQVLDDMKVRDFGGWVISDPKDPESSQALRYEQFIPPLVKAVQEIYQLLTSKT